ncbi:hypothetical protein [Nocardia sp. NPDC050175]|uniref:hypothetical protein n=1 Tax=Nocardia sp. NPDC050175 TaxID=3364317 RepID=UPI0037A49C6D
MAAPVASAASPTYSCKKVNARDTGRVRVFDLVAEDCKASGGAPTEKTSSVENGRIRRVNGGRKYKCELVRVNYQNANVIEGYDCEAYVEKSPN